MTRRVPGLLSIGLLVVVILLLAGVARLWLPLLGPLDTGQASAPLPFDPLTPEETRLAESLARQDATARPYLDPPARTQLIYIERRDVGDKALALDPKTPRVAHVVYYVYARGQTIEDVTLSLDVDLTAKQVVDSQRLTDMRPPLTRAEVDAALALAKGDTSVQAALAKMNVAVQDVRANALAHRPPSASVPCATNRCLELFLSTSDTSKQALRTIVNLTLQRVEWVAPVR